MRRTRLHALAFLALYPIACGGPEPACPDCDPPSTDAGRRDARSFDGGADGDAGGEGGDGGARDGGPPAVTDYDPNRYVTADATGDGDGTEAAPWTLPQALELAVAGDVVQVAPGVYEGRDTGKDTTPTFGPSNSGTADQPIVFFAQHPASHEPDPARRSRLRRTGGTDGPIIGVGYAARRSYIVFDGFWFDYADGIPSSRGLVYLGGENHHITVRRLRFDRADLGFDDDWNNFNCIHVHGAAFSTITDSRFVGGYDPGPESGSHNEACIATYGAADMTIEHNSFEEVTCAMYIKGSNDGVGNSGVIRWNHFRRFRMGVELTTTFDDDATPPVELSHNLFEDWSGPAASHAIAFEDSVPPANRNFLVLHNTVVASSTAGAGPVAIEPAGVSLRGNAFRDNLVAAIAPTEQVLVNASGTESLAPFADWSSNWYWNGGAPGEFALGSTVYAGLAAWQAATGRDEGSSFADPRFVDAAGGDYRLAAGSPALTASSTGGPVGAYVSGAEEMGVRADPPY